jgi:hypothetical protein
MLRGQDRRQWKGTYDLHFNHHITLRSLQDSAAKGCGICRVLFKEVFPDTTVEEVRRDSDTADEALEEAAGPVSTASLAVIRNLQDHRDEVYRLDFKVNHHRLRKKRTFVLKQIGTNTHSRLSRAHAFFSDMAYRPGVCLFQNAHFR